MRGRLAPTAIYPAGVPGIAVRTPTLPNGIALRVLESGPRAGEPVVLVHGWGACVYTFRHTIDALAASGRRVLAYDLRGHGLSEKPAAPDAYTAAALVDDLLGILDSHELEVTDLVGHSLGGGVALRFALSHRDRVRRLVLASPVGLTNIPLRRIASWLTPRLTDRFARYLVPRWVTSFLLRGAYGDPRRVSDEDIDEYWSPSQFPNYYRAVRGLLHRFDWQPVSSGELRELGMRTLVILGSADRLIRGAEERARALPAISTLTIEGAGHLGVEEYPTEFNVAVRRFLDGERFP